MPRKNAFCGYPEVVLSLTLRPPTMWPKLTEFFSEHSLHPLQSMRARCLQRAHESFQPITASSRDLIEVCARVCAQIPNIFGAVEPQIPNIFSSEIFKCLISLLFNSCVQVRQIYNIRPPWSSEQIGLFGVRVGSRLGVFVVRVGLVLSSDLTRSIGRP